MKKILIALFCALLFIGTSFNVTGLKTTPKIQDLKQIETSDDLIDEFIEITEDYENILACV